MENASPVFADLKIGPDPSPSQAHCATCRLTFGGISLFDAHRRAGRCLDPRKVRIGGFGLKPNERGVWKTDAPHPRATFISP